MDRRSLFLIFFTAIVSASATISPDPVNLPSSKLISDLKEVISKGLGFRPDEFKISGFDFRDTLIGQSVAYEFDIEVDNKVLPFKLLEDVKNWEIAELPFFRPGASDVGENSLTEKRSGPVLPVLAPFQLAGPMELWIQDGEDMRLSLPNDVDAGVLKKVILAEGAVVTVQGAKSVSLRQPLQLPLPLNRTHKGLASGLVALSERLRLASHTQQKPLLSLRIVGPSSIAAPANAHHPNKLKLKRLAPGYIELFSSSKPIPSTPTISIKAQENEPSSASQQRNPTNMWPLASVNASNSNLRGFEELLAAVLGEKANKRGSFRLLRAEASAQTFLKMGFELEKGVDEVKTEGFAEWMTKPLVMRLHFEVLATVDGENVIPERVVQVEPVLVENTVARNVLQGNVSMSQVPVVYPPPGYFTL